MLTLWDIDVYAHALVILTVYFVAIFTGPMLLKRGAELFNRR